MKHIFIAILIVNSLIAFAGVSSSFIKASGKGDFAKIIKLYDKGANINARDRYGFTALHKAAGNNEYKVVKWLIENGADVNQKNQYGGTALHEAAKHGHKQIVELLLDNGAKPFINRFLMISIKKYPDITALLVNN